VGQHGRFGDGGVARDQSSAFFSPPGTPWAYSGQETMRPSAPVTASINLEASDGVRSPSSSGLKIGRRPSPSWTVTRQPGGALRANAASRAELVEAARRLPEMARMFGKVWNQSGRIVSEKAYHMVCL